MAMRYDFSRLNVLVVEDNRHMLTLLMEVLRSLQFGKVHDVKDAVEAFKILKNFGADLILSDWNMEPLDGLDFVRLVRTANDSPNPYVPIIMVTGFTETSRVEEARDAGVNEFLAKPISIKGLTLRIIEVIERPRPFIRTKSFFGPDRRRQDTGVPPGKTERRDLENQAL